MICHTTKRNFIFTCILLIFTGVSYAQSSHPLLLKSGNIEIANNIEQSKRSFFSASNSASNNLRIIQFSEIPTNETKKALSLKGIKLLHYLPKNAFYAIIENGADWQALVSSEMTFVTEIKNNYKLSADLNAKKYNDWALPNKHTIALNATYFNHFTETQIIAALEDLGANNVNLAQTEVANFTIAIQKLESLYAKAPFYYFEQIDPPSEPENLVGVTNHRSNTLATSYNNGLKLNGQGVTLMLQDNSRLDDHIDYTGRFINSSNASNSGDHGEHCGGIIAGAGNIDPTARGMAFGAEVLVYSPSDANYNSVPNLVQNNNLTITSKSYGGGLNAGYNNIARTLDQQIRNNPSLMHIFSAGNSNGSGFTSAGSQWFNITGGHKSGKNVMAIGNLTSVDNIANSSSRGPSEDGRIKPDICAVGTSVYSTVDPNQYDTKTGTSMACPGVAGTMAQLYQGYKELNGGSNPNSALIKAAILNTGEDLGNPGPDFIYGWGRINARRAYEIIANNQYFTDDISQGANLNHTISVPSGISQLRVMVYWSDYEASTSASQALVNDINMTITDPGAATWQPWVLNNTANSAQLSSVAIPGSDNENNMEQITIDNPMSGSFTVNLNGASVPQGPQKYFVVYEFVNDDVVLTYPIGGESFDPAENEFIRWDAFGDNGTFDVEYSTDNGATWITINSNVSAERRFLAWNVPSVVTGEAIVRVTRGASVSQSHSNFSIIGVPAALNVSSVCADSIVLNWNAVNGATGYEVSFLGNLYMDSVGTSNTTTLKVAHSSTDELWWSVKALGANNCIGRRAIAQYQQPGIFNCILNTDIGINDPQSIDGRSILNCMTSDTLTIGITLTNTGLNTLSNVPVRYQLNNGTIVNEVYNATMTPNSSVFYTFVNQPNIPFGSNTLSMWADYPNDENPGNDSIYSVFSLLNAAPVSLPFFEDFESFSLCNTTSNCEAELCQLSNNFINSRNGLIDDIDWRTNSGTTPSSSTGPSTDFNPGTNNGRYLYLEPSATPVCAFKAAHLITPCIDLNNGAILTFGYSMNGADIGDLHVDIMVNGTWIDDIMPVLSGNKGPNWNTETIDLTPYAGNIVNLRFRGVTGDDFRGDIAIDAISITSTAGIANSENQNFTLYPNPSTGLFFYKTISATNSTISVMDANGKEVYRAISENDNGSIDLTNLSAGIYFVRAVMDATTIVKKIIIE